MYWLLPPINTPDIAINYGNWMSTKGWPVHEQCAMSMANRGLAISPKSPRRSRFLDQRATPVKICSPTP